MDSDRYIKTKLPFLVFFGREVNIFLTMKEYRSRWTPESEPIKISRFENRVEEQEFVPRDGDPQNLVFVLKFEGNGGVDKLT